MHFWQYIRNLIYAFTFSRLIGMLSQNNFYISYNIQIERVILCSRVIRSQNWFHLLIVLNIDNNVVLLLYLHIFKSNVQFNRLNFIFLSITRLLCRRDLNKIINAKHFCYNLFDAVIVNKIVIRSYLVASKRHLLYKCFCDMLCRVFKQLVHLILCVNINHFFNII